MSHPHPSSHCSSPRLLEPNRTVKHVKPTWILNFLFGVRLERRSEAQRRGGWQEKGAIPLCEGGGGYLLITTVRDQTGINFGDVDWEGLEGWDGA